MSQKNKNAFSLIEVILVVALFAIFLASSLRILLGARFDLSNSADQMTASYYLQESLEALHSIRDYDSDNLSPGTFGLSEASGYWELSGSSDSYGKFTRTVVLSAVDSYRYDVVATVSWTTVEGIERSISSTFRITDQDSFSLVLASLEIDSSGAQLKTGDSKVVEGILLSNTGESDLTITDVTVTWTGGSSGNQIQEIVIDGSSVWSGNKNSGTLLDVSDVTITAGSTINMDSLSFKKNMTGAVLILEFTLSDGSTALSSSISL